MSWKRSSTRGLRKLSPAAKIGLSLTAMLAGGKLISASLRRKVEIRGKVVLITGGSRGLGLVLATEFAQRGARLALVARDERELEDARMRLEAENAETALFVCDLTDRTQAESLIERVLQRLGQIDILVNNAGLISVAPFDSVEIAEYQRAMDLMFWAPLHLSFAVLPHMEARGSGHIVNISSIGGRVSVPHLLPYSCAKFALTGFSTGLCSDAKAKGIHVLTVIPGLMRTGSYLQAQFGGDTRREFAWFAVLGNLPGFSVAAEYAASKIVRALESGRNTLTISLPAKMMVAMEALMPDTLRRIYAVLNRVLPEGRQPEFHAGEEVNTTFGAGFQAATVLGRRSADRLNEHKLSESS